MKLKQKKNKRLPEIKKYIYTDLYVNMPTRGLLSFHTKDCPVSVVAKAMFTYKCDLLLLNASKKYRSKKERLAQNVVHVGKKQVIGISCLYPCLLYFVVPTLNFKHVFSWLRSSRCGKRSKVKGKEFGHETMYKGEGKRGSISPSLHALHSSHPPKMPFPFPSKEWYWAISAITNSSKKIQGCLWLDRPSSRSDWILCDYSNFPSKWL